MRSAEKAAEFAEIYAESLKTRYQDAKETVNAASGPSADEKRERKHPILLGRHTWNTEEGTVVIEDRGDTVLVSESLDSATTQTVEKEVFGK